MSLLEVKNIRKSYGKLEVLKGIDFSLEKGEVLSILGSSGSGKTTLLRCLNFLETPDTGSISINGKEIYNASVQKHLSEKELRQNHLHFGLVFQSFNLFPQYTVLKNRTVSPRSRSPNAPAICCARWACTTRPLPIRVSSRAANSSVWPSRAHSA